MKTSNKLIAAALAALALAGSGLALAHNGMGDGMGGPMAGMGPMGNMNGNMDGGMHHGMGMHGGGRHGGPGAADVGAHLAALKTELQITAVQEPAWKAFEATVQKHVQARDAMRTAMQDPKATAPADPAARREQMMKLRDTQRAEHDAARTALYAVLTPAQKTLADQRLAGGPRHRMGQGMGGPNDRPMGQHRHEG